MKVIHIDTGKDWRGGQSQVLMLAEGMKARGHEVMIAARRGSALAERAREQNLECREVPFRFEVDLASAMTLSRMAAAEEASTLIHCHTPHALGLAILARKLGTPRPILFTRRVAFPIKELFVNRWKINRADRIVAVSRTVCAEMVAAGVPSEKIRVIYSAVDARAYSYHGPNMEFPLNLVIVAAVVPSKGIKDAMRCAEISEHLPVRFHFIGTGKDLNTLKTWAAPRNNAVVHGFVRDVPSFLPRMFGALSFSPSEGFPNAVLQAMAVGLPVLARENDAVREILIREEWGHLFKTPAEAMARIADWVSNKETAAADTRSGSEWVLSRYSQDVMVDQTLNLYKEMLA